jgi:predicted O-methyltransferase YrrM
MTSLRHRLVQIVRTGTLTPESPQPLGTHVPVLVGLARLVKLRRVAEFGCGQFSTLSLTDRSAFPDLEVLHSFENDPQWLEEIRTRTAHDPRVEMSRVDGRMGDAAAGVDVRDYDLVFIDDSKRAEDRAATIRAVWERRAPLVAIHDFEVFAYRRAAAGYRKRYRFTSLLPNTGILWNDDRLRDDQLRRLEDSIKRHRGELRAEDVRGWTRVLNDVAD